MHAKTDGNAMSVSQARACRVSANKTTATHKPAIWTGNLLVSEPQHVLWCETCERTTSSYEITCCMCEHTDHNLTNKKNCIDPQTSIIPHSCHHPTNKKQMEVLWTCRPWTRWNRLAAVGSDTFKSTSYAQCGSTYMSPTALYKSNHGESLLFLHLLLSLCQKITTGCCKLYRWNLEFQLRGISQTNYRLETSLHQTSLIWAYATKHQRPYVVRAPLNSEEKLTKYTRVFLKQSPVMHGNSLRWTEQIRQNE
jgi:hypothetical protein